MDTTINPKDIQNLIILAYEDYMAARHLVRTKFGRHAAIQASTAVERYLKALIIGHKGVIKHWVHLDNLPKITSQLVGTLHENILDTFDANFILLLGKVYKMRYLDKSIDSTLTMGFFNNQFLGELDYTINALESCFKIQGWETPYRTALREKDPELIDDNWVLNLWDKHAFMSRLSEFYGITYDVDRESIYLTTLKQPHMFEYKGKMFYLKVEMEDSNQN